MATVIKFIICWCFLITYVLCIQSFIENINGKYDTPQHFKINNSVEYVIEYPEYQDKFPVRVTVLSASSTVEEKLLVVAEYRNHITLWKLPYIDKSFNGAVEYKIAGHILCPANSSTSRRMSTPRASNPVVTVKSLSEDTHDFTITAHKQTDFLLKNNEVYSTNVTPSEPIYYYYNFRDLGNEAEDSWGVLVQVNSDSDECMIVSIQNLTCPVNDLQSNIKFNSYWQTMNFQAGIVVPKEQYPDGFYIVMVVTDDDIACKEVSNTTENKIKIVTVKVTNTITYEEHLKITLGTLAIFASILIVCAIIQIIYLIKRLRRNLQQVSRTNGNENETLLPSPIIQIKTSPDYIWHVVIVALLYAVLVLQLVITKYGIMQATGNEDLCYYNFLCAHPLWYITDFNHVFSNIGYVILGLVFMIITWIKKRHTSSNMYGLPKPFGMYYTLGFALIMEGVMSASYHVCPTSSHFHFDTNFMYIMTLLMMVTLYENRQASDKRGYAVFGILAIATNLCILALLIGETLYFWIFFGIIQILVCLGLTWTIDKSLFRRAWTHRQDLTQVHIYQIILWIIVNVMNWSIIVYGICTRNGFATYLLMVLIINGIFYTFFYITLKICYMEPILTITWVFIILAIIFWAASLYFFIKNVTSWEKLPAESRNLNKECSLAQYYDNHDIWHFLSSIGLFFTFIVLFTLDDGLSQTPRAAIKSFHKYDWDQKCQRRFDNTQSKI